ELPGRAGDLLGLEQHALGRPAERDHAQARRQDRAVGQSQVDVCAQEEPAAWLPDDRGRRARYRTRGMAASAGVWVGVGGTEPLAIWLPSSSYENLGDRSGSALILRSVAERRVSKDVGGPMLRDAHTQVGFTRLARLKRRSRVNPRSVCAPQHEAARE